MQHRRPSSLRGSPRASLLLAQQSRRRLLAGALLLVAVVALLRAGRGPAAAGGQQQTRNRVARRVAAEVLPAAATLAAAVEAEPAAAVQAAAAAVTASAGVHGYVTKEGPADPRCWHHDYKGLREERLAAWLDERQAALAAGAPPPPLPIFMGCQVFVNHLYKVIYLRHAKTASSSLFCHFGGCREPEGADDGDTARLRFDLLQVDSAEEIERLWREYFVVTFVRNPYQRAVSSYRMMARQLAPGAAPYEGLTWDAFCADPASFADTCMADERCRTRGRNFVYVHIQPQQQCIVTERGGWAVDFIGRVENIDEDLRTVLAELERRRPADAPPVKPLEGTLENVNGRGCNESAPDPAHAVAKEQYCEPVDFFTGRHNACFAAIRHHYEADASLLQYGPGWAEGSSGGGRRARAAAAR